jgi:hypothetical protein
MCSLYNKYPDQGIVQRFFDEVKKIPQSRIFTFIHTAKQTILSRGRSIYRALAILPEQELRGFGGIKEHFK